MFRAAVFKIVFTAGLGPAFLLVGCLPRSSQNPRDKVVVSVNGDILTAAEFGTRLASRLKTYDALAVKDPINIERESESICQDFIVSSLLAEYAHAHGITVSQQEVDKEIKKRRADYPDDLSFKASMVDNDLSYDRWKKNLQRTLLEKKAMAAMTADEMAKVDINHLSHEYYDEHKSQFDRPAEAHIKQIVVAKRDDAERIAQQLKKGEPFDVLAKKFSLGPEATEGGDLGYVEKGTLPVFDNAFSLKPGTISGILKSTYGFHILKLVDKRAASHLSYEQTRADVERKVRGQIEQEIFSKWLKGAISKSKIEKNDGLIRAIRPRTEDGAENL